MKKVILIGLLSSLAVLFFSSYVLASGLESYQLLKLSAQDHRAVVKTPTGKLQVVGVGDVLGDTAKIVEVSENRIVLEEITVEGMVKTIIRLDGDQQHVETIRQEGGKLPRIVVPVQ